MLIETHAVTKKYGKRLALADLNLTINQGQLVAYLGTNGAGKSTTINILTGLLAPTSGTINYAPGVKIGMVFQDSVLDDSLTVKTNLLLRARLEANYDKQWLAELSELIGIRQFMNQKYGTLSGGQRRRVDIARALFGHPNILFLDEPTTGLDLQTRLAIWNLLQKLQREQGMTIFLTTHYLEEAATADQMYILENGHLLASGSATSIKERFAPTKLIITTIDDQSFETSYPHKQTAKRQVTIYSLTASQALTVLNTHRQQINDFSYQHGAIDDAFIAITGKELQ